MVQSGANLIQEDTRKGHSRDITDMVEMAMNLLLEDSGLDLHSIFGTGSQSVACSIGGLLLSRFVLKLASKYKYRCVYGIV